MLKRILLLSVILLIYKILPLYGNDDFIIQGAVLVKYAGESEHIIIPDNLGITEIGEKAFGHALLSMDNNKTLKSVTIPEGVTIIGKGAFNKCVNLVKVSMPESIVSIGDDAFWGCSSLIDIAILFGVITLKQFFFRGMPKLTDTLFQETRILFSLTDMY